MSLSCGDIVKVERGIQTLIDSSHERGDGKYDFLKEKKSIIIHRECRKEYTRKCTIIAVKRQRDAKDAGPSISPPRVRTRSSGAFSFEKECIFCGKEASDEEENKKKVEFRRPIRLVSTISFKNSVMEYAEQRGDIMAKSVVHRLEYEDLEAVKARYHLNCWVSFKKPPKENKAGRPEDKSVSVALEQIYKYIEENDDCQFTFNELKEICVEEPPNEKTVKNKLKEKYGSQIVITEQKGSTAIICFNNRQHEILSQEWHNYKKQNEGEERLRILKTAAQIIREDIISTVVDNKFYPPPSQMFDNINDGIPSSLVYFLEKIILYNKRCNTDRLKLTCTAIGHAIMSAVRPRSFLSSLQLGIAIFFHRRFGSRRLIDVLSSFGLCASYQHVSTYEAAAVNHPPPHILPPESGTLVQFVADNADVNVNTIDGHNTLHIMGIIKIVTPKSSVVSEEPIERESTKYSAGDIASKAVVPIQIYENTEKVGLSKINVLDLHYEETTNVSFLRKIDIIWLFGKFRRVEKLPGWNGFIEQLSRTSSNFSMSTILFLPFIHHPASNFNTIYTTLICALKEAKSHGQSTCVITFDQPLYAKAREIVAAAPLDSELSQVVVRLGGFHLVMSYLGAVGFIMQGSGIKEVLSVMYAPNSIDKMLNGHAYSRAVRGHTLLHLALAVLILKDIDVDEDEDGSLKTTIENIINCISSYEDIENCDEIAENLLHKFNEKLHEYGDRGPTAKLWVQYFQMISIAKEFIRAERMGDWSSHLNSIKQMLPYFHAAGHHNYAKSAHLYLQDMMQLENLGNSFMNKFREGFFTIRRSDKFSCGTWSDMIIEQSLMKSMKTNAGISRGRSTKESVLSKWVHSMHAMNSVCEGLENLCKVKLDTTDQHVDARDSRIERDVTDVNKIMDWFSCHYPFPQLPYIMSLSSGIIGDDNINCHQAYQVGLVSMQNMKGVTFDKIKLKRSNNVHSLLTVKSSIKVHGEKVAIDPLLLFQRISLTKHFEGNLQHYFEYELSPYPLSLFDETGMRKNKKSALYELLETVNNETNYLNVTYIVDGGYLLHRVVWHRDETFDNILNSYIGYVKKHFGNNVIIVFDGYNDNANNIKASEQYRRYAATASSADILFNESMTVPTTQQSFLANKNNKSYFIAMLMKKFEAASILVKQAKNDADVLIVETAIQQSYSRTSIIVGEDVDLLVILIGRAPQKKIYFRKPGRGNIKTKIYSSESLISNPKSQEYILFLHAITGCDTTSALYNKGKLKIFKLFEKSKELINCAKVFLKPDATHIDIVTQGLRFLLEIYRAPKTIDSIDELRYSLFAKSSKFNRPVQLVSLPPTSAAAQQHFYRAYFQIQVWLGNHLLVPENWGWTLNNMVLEPVTTLLQPAPDLLLNTVFCNCSKGCGTKCGCRRAGLSCSAVCSHCHGQACLNTDPKNCDEEETNNDLSPSYVLEQPAAADSDLEDDIDLSCLLNSTMESDFDV